MATISEALAIAVEHHRAGRLAEAAQIYRRILAAEPNQPDAWHQLGLIAHLAGKDEVAGECIGRAIGLSGEVPAFHCDLGVVNRALRRTREAVACYRRALELDADFAEAHYNLGNALRDQGRLDEAVAAFRRAVELNPRLAEAHGNLGGAMHQKRELREAAACFQRALELRPGDAAAHGNLGLVFRDQGRLEEAIASYRRALELQPGDAAIHNNLGAALYEQGKLTEAEACYRRALELAPGDAKVHSNLGIVLYQQRRLGEAEACHRRALELDQDLAAGHEWLGATQLLRGNLRRGWPELEWRLRAREVSPRLSLRPRWDGCPLAGKTVLLHAEVGLGDTIQFIRYAPLVKQFGGKVVVECQKALLPLLATYPGIDQLVGGGDELPEFDTHAPLPSLPGIFQTSLDAIPATVPYLFAASALTESWHERLRELPGYKIGINWHGRAGYTGRARTIPLKEFAAVAGVPGVRLISLQKGTGAEELAGAQGRFPILDFGGDVDHDHGAFMDTAAIMMNLDLVVTSDTAVAHLAGALGVPVWVALPFAPDWRWLLDRSDSPWYPTMRLFRQKSPGDWVGVFGEIAAALEERLRAGGAASSGTTPAAR